MSAGKTRSLMCLNCQSPMRVDLKAKPEKEKNSLDEASTADLAGQSWNLMELICSAEVPSNAPICKECSDELLVGMDQQLQLLEDDCAVYRQLIDSLKEKYSSADIASYKQTLRNLKDEERALKAQFDQLCLEEERLDAELMEKRASLEKKTEEEAKTWLQFRDNHR
ncbi:hypothetical protein KIN20_026648 [Parelaphostrongylus tenuis]|uniref:Atg6/beclin coiled-coil domain-containing protein n=1 Tax=Parelaphostrongylus tenuis TaxID=148309 RepID=A0AAD5WCY5_PARTN|nr:hypothetical protein KIN20_026648 [Parelaphostrongylus tenuis]